MSGHISGMLVDESGPISMRNVIFYVRPATVVEPPPTNNAPVLNHIGDRGVVENGTLQFTASASDADDDNLTFSLDGGMETTGATIDANTGAFSWDATGFAIGDYNVTIRVTDDGSPNLSDSEAIVVSVVAAGVPAITYPNDLETFNVTEGDFIEVAFTAISPNNAKLTYTIERMIGGSPAALPSGAEHAITLAAERSLRWWPDLTQNGSYDFRFSVVDEFAQSADPVTITVVVANRTTTPAIVDLFQGDTMHSPDATIEPNEELHQTENRYTRIGIGIADPESGSMTISQSGAPAGTNVIQNSATSWTLQYLHGAAPGAHTDIGSYPFTITVTDGTNTSDVDLTLTIDLSWRHDDERIDVQPRAAASFGLVREVTRSGSGNWVAQILAGSVTFTPHGGNSWNESYLPTPRLPSDMKWRLCLHTPDISGNDVKTYLSGVQSGLDTVVWDSTGVADGTYVVQYEFLSGSATAATDISRYVAVATVIIVDNDSAPEIGAQWLPIDPFDSEGYRFRFRGAMEAVQWVHYDGNPATGHTVRPWSYTVYPAPTTTPARADLVSSSNWVLEPITGPLINRYTTEPAFVETAEGHPFVGFVTWEGFDASYEGGVTRFFERDGGRLNCAASSWTQFRPVPGASKNLVGVGAEGRVTLLKPDATGNDMITTIAGWRLDPTSLPLFDDSIDYLLRKELVGTFEGDVIWDRPYDLVFNPDDANQVFVADSGKNRIVKVNLTTGAVTNYAGDQTVGYLDGARLSAKFSKPSSVEVIGRVLYVADTNNSAIRAIDLDTGIVSTWLGRGSGAPAVPSEIEVGSDPDAWTYASIAFDDSPVPYPVWIRRTSESDLVIQELGAGEGRGTANLRRADVSEQIVYQILRAYGEPFECDWRGNAGPIDDILISHIPQTSALGRIGLDGTPKSVVTPLASPIYYGAGEAAPLLDEGFAPYGLRPCIDDQEARITFVSVYRGGVMQLRPRQVGDPASSHNAALYDEGRIINMIGTDWRFGNGTSRTGFASFHGRFGHNWLGATETYNDWTSLTNAQLAASIVEDGLGTNLPRPDLTARALQSFIYYIRMTSDQGKLETIDPANIQSDLEAAGYWPSDTVQPEIRDVVVANVSAGVVTISWFTDELCCCMVMHNRRNYFGVFASSNDGIEQAIKSAITAESKSHSVTFSGLVTGATYYYKIKARDRGGNWTVSNAASFVAP